MKKLLLIIFAFSLAQSFACDKTSITITDVTYDGTTYYYTAQVCIGISPNWGETNSFSIDITGACATGLTTTSFTSTYNYCSTSLSFNGQGCATTAMGTAPAGGTVQTANVNVSGSVGGGGCSTSYNFTASGGDPIAPDDLDGDCADCGNPTSLCWDITFETDAEITSAQLVGAEGGNTTCPDEFDTTIPAAPPACSLPTLGSTTINGSSSVTVCEGDAVNLSSTCTSNCSGSFTWTGPDGYSGSGSTDTDNPVSSGAYTVTYGSGSCVTSASVDVVVQALPTAALNTAAIDACTSADVPITFTGTGPYTFSYSDDGGSTWNTVTTSDNPYIVPVSADGTVLFSTGMGGAPAEGVTSGTCAGTGTTSGTTNVTISTVTADAGTDWSVLAGIDENLDATGTAGLDGYDTTITPTTTTDNTSGTFLNNDPVTGFTAGSINISSLGLSCSSISFDNIPDNAICFTYTGSKAGNIKAELCLGGTCITIEAGGINGSPYCFDKGDVFNLLNGAACNSGTLTLQVWDMETGGGPAADDGTFTGWTVTLNEFNTTLIDNPTYTWTASSGDADVSYLSCTDCEDPVFNSPTAGAGCYLLTVTDGFGCTTTDEVCYTTTLSMDIDFDLLVTDRETVQIEWQDPNKKYESFVIERTTNKEEFLELGTVTNNDAVEKLSFEDSNPLNEAYYRIKGLLSDGSYEYTDLKHVMLNSSKGLEVLRSYPIPTSDVLYLEIHSSLSGNLTYKIVDTKGQIIKENQSEISRGNSTLNLNTSEMVPGNYMLILNNGNAQVITKIVKD